MTTQAGVGIRRKITMTFAAACTAVIVFTVVVIQFQLSVVDRGAQAEARDLARSVAYSVALDNGHLQQYIEGLHEIYRRDIVVVNGRKQTVADADETEIGDTFIGDSANEVGKIGRAHV